MYTVNINSLMLLELQRIFNRHKISFAKFYDVGIFEKSAGFQKIRGLFDE